MRIPLFERVDLLSLHLRTIPLHTPKSLTINAVLVHVSAFCQVKFQGWSSHPANQDGVDGQTVPAGLVSDRTSILLAAQHFVGKNDKQIEHTIQSTIIGHQRSIISSMTIEQLIHDREAFCNQIVQHCDEDMRNMGLAIVSYTVNSITDSHGYIEALGLAENERVQRSKIEGEARHQARAKIIQTKRETATHISNNKQYIRQVLSDKNKAIVDAKSAIVVERMRAERQKAYAIQSAVEERELLRKKQLTHAAELRGDVLVTQQTVRRQRLALQRQVEVTADSKLYKSILKSDAEVARAHASAERIVRIATAEAEAEAQRIRSNGFAEAAVEAAVVLRAGLAEAEAIRRAGIAEAEVSLKQANKVREQGMARLDVLERRLKMWKEQYVYFVLSTRVRSFCNAFLTAYVT